MLLQLVSQKKCNPLIYSGSIYFFVSPVFLCHSFVKQRVEVKAENSRLNSILVKVLPEMRVVFKPPQKIILISFPHQFSD